MTFDEAEKYLLSLGNEVSAMKLGLESMRELLEALGNPEKNYLKVQVAGTNGKGSACAFLNSICLRAGIKTGMYTSPHLISVTERIQIDGTNVSEDEFARLATRVRETSERLVEAGSLENVPTFFEQVTAIALLAFGEASIALAILETGLGGRLDATTAANAEIAAITRIDLDHQQYLGETLTEIAAEKAAIIHEGSKVVIGEQQREAMEVIVGRCESLGITPVLSTTQSLPQVLPPLGLAGRHQIENARVAVATAEVLREHFSISDADITAGLESAHHPGRLEFVDGILLDGAHNIGGALALKEFLDESIKRPVVMVFGAMNDKDAKEIMSILFPKANTMILTRPDNSRAIPPPALFDLLPAAVDRKEVFVTETVEEALAKAREVSTGGDLIVVTGSLYLVGEVKRLLSI